MSRRSLRGIHTTIARKNRHAAGSSSPSAPRHDMPLDRLSMKQLDEAGAGLLPAREVCPVCLGTREVQQQVTDNLTVTAPCAECGGRGYYVEES